MDFVVGATGTVGGEICALLTKAGRKVRGLTRPQSDPGRVAELKKLGVEVVEGDLKDSSWMAKACDGVETLYTTASALPVPKEGDEIGTVDLAGQKSLIAAAKAAGVQNVVYTSFPRYDDVHFPLGDAKNAVEDAIKTSGVPYTILQASFFNETWLSAAVGFDWASGAVRVYGDGNQKVAFIAAKDVAKYAVASPGNVSVKNRVVKVGGPESVTPNDVVGMFEAAGKPLKVEHAPESALQEQLAGADNDVMKSFLGLMITISRGDGIDTAAAHAAYPSVELTKVSDFVKQITS
jgi:uncharacterized protein YbjT (DUF2867 family)